MSWQYRAYETYGSRWSDLVARWDKQGVMRKDQAARLGISPKTLWMHLRDRQKQKQGARAAVDACIEDGRLSFDMGRPEACPYPASDMTKHCAWLAGYRDAARGLA